MGGACGTDTVSKQARVLVVPVSVFVVWLIRGWWDLEVVASYVSDLNDGFKQHTR